MKVSNWGKYPVIHNRVISYSPDLHLNGVRWIARGMGRCYGDASLGETMLSSHKLNRFLHFNPESGELTCESGITFADLLETFVPLGWFPPVTPGTKFVSMGGAFASDVHGKNHHKEGSFSRYVHKIDLLLANGEVVSCSRNQHPELFQATIGGMGLTGMILRLTLQLKSIETSRIRMESFKAHNLDEILSLFDEFESQTYSVAWIDCLSGGRRLGRSILMKGEHATARDLKGTKDENKPLVIPLKRKLNIPFNLPVFTLNRLTTSAFNWLYYHKQFRKEVHSITDYDAFFYPLDVIHNWNRIYGKRGFTQYQLVIPKEGGKKGITQILHRLQKSGMGSFLAVLKLLGDSEGLISFPMKGYTLTLDFPISRKLFPFLDELDKIVADYGGRIYLSKDVRLSPEIFARTYSNLQEFKKILDKWNPEGKIRSLQSERLGIH